LKLTGHAIRDEQVDAGKNQMRTMAALWSRGGRR